MALVTAPARVARPDATTTPPSTAMVVLAHLLVVCSLPSGLWRVALAASLPIGFSDDALRSLYDVPGWGSLTIVGLSVVQEGLALLCLGLVRPWGEVLPAWVPLLGGRRIPTAAAVVPALVGALALIAITVSQLLAWKAMGHDGLSDPGRRLMAACYAPLLAWGPLLLLLATDRAWRGWRGRRLSRGRLSRTRR